MKKNKKKGGKTYMNKEGRYEEDVKLKIKEKEEEKKKIKKHTCVQKDMQV